MHTLAGALKNCLKILELEEAQRTIQTYGYHLSDFAKWLEHERGALALEEIDPPHIQGFLIHLKSRAKRPGNGYRTKPAASSLKRRSVWSTAFYAASSPALKGWATQMVPRSLRFSDTS